MEFMKDFDEGAGKRYPISDIEFQNIIIWLNISHTEAHFNFFYLNDEDIDGEGVPMTHKIKNHGEYL